MRRISRCRDWKISGHRRLMDGRGCGFGGCAVHGLEARAAVAPLFEDGEELGGELSEEVVGEVERPKGADEVSGFAAQVYGFRFTV